MSDLITRLRNNGRLQHVRDHEYFAWRFQNPRKVYRFVFCGNSHLGGYLVLRWPQKSKGGPVIIVDWEAVNLQIRARLLDTIITLGNFVELLIWAMSLSTEEKQLLRQRGFDFIDNKNASSDDMFIPDVLMRPTNPQELNKPWIIANRDLRNIENWSLRAIDADGM